MHPPSGPAWLVWLETSSVAVAMRQWTWLYPAVEIAHIVGFVTLVGAALMFDARLLGRSRPLPVSALERHLLPWARWSVALVLLLTAFLNAGVFHRWPFRTVSDWDTEIHAPLAARVNGVLSIALWISVIACGRLIAYF